MESNIDLTQIDDITKLKALKSDQYDRIAAANANAAEANTNLTAINTRINQVEQIKAEQSGVAAGAGELNPVTLDVAPGA